MPHTIDNGNVFYSDGKLTMAIGAANKTQTLRIDSETVEDISYEFDLDAGDYIEVDRMTRAEALPPQPKTEVELLQEENAELKTRVSATEDAIIALMDMQMM